MVLASGYGKVGTSSSNGMSGRLDDSFVAEKMRKHEQTYRPLKICNFINLIRHLYSLLPLRICPIIAFVALLFLVLIAVFI